MSKPTLSVTIATSGRRPSLDRTLAALVPQLGPDDEVLVLYDGEPAPAVVEILERWTADPRVHAYQASPQLKGDWGHSARNWALQNGLAQGQWLLWIDDDNTHVPDALATLRTVLADAPLLPHLFRTRHHLPGGAVVLWRLRAIAESNVGLHMIVTPNDPAKLGRFGNRYAGDFDFVQQTIQRHGGLCVWRTEILTDVYPVGPPA